MNYRAFDTETINRLGHGEACLLIRMGLDGAPEVFEFPRTFDDCFDFLVGGRWVAWNMDFDCRAIVHPNFLPFEVVEKLGLFGKADWKSYRFKYVPMKFLEVFKHGQGHFELYDLKQFYGTSLAAAAKAHLPLWNQKATIPKSWYNDMDGCLRDRRRQRVVDYACQDVVSTQALADKLLNSIRGMGLNPRRLSSCAGLARLKNGKILKQVRPPDYVNRIFERSFFGGRIEVGVLGRVGNCSLYDIHSAYPSVLARLVDPRGRVVESGHEWKYRRAAYGSYEIRVYAPLEWKWGPLAVRRGNRVVYPVGVFRTYCGVPAIDSLRRRGVMFEIIKAYEIFQDDKTPIFPDIEALYLKRKDPALSLAIKTVLNSLYGLCAEQTYFNFHDEAAVEGREVGGHLFQSRSKFGRLANFILAAHVTESIRMKLWEVLHHVGNQAFFCATDGVLLKKGVTMDEDDHLGGWGRKNDFSDGTVLGCGRYALSGEGFTEQHLRGFPLHESTFERLGRIKRRFAEIPALNTESMRQWAGDPFAEFNVLRKFKRRLEIKDDKRHWPFQFKAIRDAWTLTIPSKPFIMGSVEELKSLCP